MLVGGAREAQRGRKHSELQVDVFPKKARWSLNAQHPERGLPRRGLAQGGGSRGTRRPRAGTPCSYGKGDLDRGGRGRAETPGPCGGSVWRHLVPAPQKLRV